MSVLKIIKNPHPTLRKESEDVSKRKIKDLQNFIDDLIITMNENNGMGLAANQVDVLKRIFVVNTKDGPLTVINPKISRKSFSKESAEEGCLSIPGVYGQVKRHKRITISGLDRDANKLKMKVEGLFARIIQHEVDHLNGVLFIDKAKKIHEPKNL